jgi:hypothetical protein
MVCTYNPKYNVFEINCEHLANFVATGQRVSPQLQAGLVIFAIAVGVYAMVKSEQQA